MTSSTRFASRSARFAGILVAGLLALVFVLVLAVGLLPLGRQILANTVSALASNEERTVTVSAPSGLLTGQLRIASITVGDRDGTYAEIGNIAVDWSPLALLRGAFHASLISADHVALDRKPLPSEKTSDDSSGFSLPIAVEIEKLSVPDMALSAPVLGQPFALAATGKVNAHRDAASLTLDIQNREQEDAHARAQLVYAPENNQLTLEASITEPEGGILTRLASLPGNPAVNLNLTGNGPLSDWQGKLTGTVADAPVIALTGHHRLEGSNHAITVAGGGTLSALLPPAFRPLFAGETRMDIAALLRSDGAIRIDSGKIDNAAFMLDARGTYDPTGGANDLTAKLSGVNGPIDFRWPLENGEARALIRAFDLSLSGPAEAARLNATAVVDTADLPAGGFGAMTLSATGDKIDLTRQAGQLVARLDIGSSHFTDENLARIIRAPIRLTAPLNLSDGTLALENIGLESAAIGGSLTGTYGLDDKNFSGAVKLFALPDTLPPALTAKLSGTLAATANLSATGGDIAVSDITVKSGLVEATGTVGLKDNALTAAIKGTLPDLGVVLADATGTAAFNASATGPLNAIAFKADVETENAVLAGKKVERLAMSASGTADPAAPKADVTLTGRLDGKPVQAAASLVSTAAGPQIPKLSLEAGANRLSGALRFTPAFLPTEGNITFDFPDVSLLAALAGQKASGTLTGNAALVARNGVTGLNAKVSGSVNGSGAALEKLSLDIAMPDISKIAVDGTLSAARAGTADAAVQNLKLVIAHAGQNTRFDLDGRYDNAPVVLKGALAQTGSAMNLSLENFAATPRGIPVRLAAPTEIGITNGTAKLNGLKIATGSGAITVSGTAGQTLDVTATLTALPASLANAFAPDLAADGTISGSVKASGTAANPAIAYQLNWANAATSQTRDAGLAPLAIKADGTFANTKLGLNTSLSGAGGLALSGGGTLEVSGSKALALAFKGRIPLAALQGKLTEQGLSAEGGADLDLSIAGNTASPAITGTVSLAGAKLIDFRHNLTLNNMTGTLRFDGQQATLTGLSARLAGGGSIAASGTIGLAAGSGFPANIAIKLSSATYADGTLFTSSPSGTLTLQGPLLSSPSLTGRITLANTSITVPEKLPATLSEIDIRHKNAPSAVTRQMREVNNKDTGSGAPSSTINLDLVVNADQGIFVRGRGIDAELGGELTIRGTANDPVVSGAFTMRRGRMSILSRRLDFSSGTITFGGALIPVLNLEATSTVSSTTITVDVTGVATDPTIAFSSSPTLPQDEIIAQLIFGQSMSKLSPLQIAQLADAVRQLAGGRSTSLFESLRSNLGVDDLDVSTDEKGQAKVSAGKYINDRTYIQLEQGGTSGSKAVINLDVGKGVKLRGEAGANGSGAAGVFYEREY